MPLAFLAFVHGLRALQGHRATARSRFAWHRNGMLLTCDGQLVRDAHVEWRGPLAFLRWGDARGRVQRRAWWPDTLPARLRRELRLAARPTRGAPGAGGMAH